MNAYVMWCDLAPGAKDLELAEAIQEWMDHLKSQGLLEGWRLTRRKLGFGPTELGEWMIIADCRDLAQLEEAWSEAARRTGETERLHGAVWSRVINFRSGLYRDFPDAVRGT